MLCAYLIICVSSSLACYSKSAMKTSTTRRDESPRRLLRLTFESGMTNDAGEFMLSKAECQGQYLRQLGTTSSRPDAEATAEGRYHETSKPGLLPVSRSLSDKLLSLITIS